MKLLKGRFILCTLLALGLIPLSLSAQIADKSTKQISDPITLVQEYGVPFTETTRTFQSEKYNGLQKYYSQLEGIVMVGVTDNQGNVLLRGPENWSPPGGPVSRGQDWAFSAQKIIQQQTGFAIKIEEPVLVERMHFHHKGKQNESFTGLILHLRASKVDESANKNNAEFRWFSKVPADAHPNHTDHIELYLEH